MCAVLKHGGACPHSVRRSELDELRAKVDAQAVEIARLRAVDEIRGCRIAAASVHLKAVDDLCVDRSDCNPLLRKIRTLASDAGREIGRLEPDIVNLRHALEEEQAA